MRRHPCPTPITPLIAKPASSTALGSAAIVAAALSFGAETANAQSKTDKKTAKYQDHPNKGQACAQCNFFRPPKSCQLVAGDISPNGWCSYWAKKA